MTMAEDPQLPSTKPSALAFHMGALTERVQNLASEQALSRVGVEQLPEKIVVLLSPRLVALEATDKEHSRRIEGLERKVWAGVGAATAISAISAMLYQLGVIVHH